MVRYYKNDTGGGNMGWWTGAEEIEMVIDAYERSNSTTYKNMITELINGFFQQRHRLEFLTASTTTSNGCGICIGARI